MYHLDASMDGCGSSVNASKRQLARSKYADLSMYDSLLGPSCSLKFDLENGELNYRSVLSFYFPALTFEQVVNLGVDEIGT